MHILTLKHISKNKKQLTLNCGYGYGFSVLNIIKKFSEFSKNQIKIIFKSRRTGDISAIIANDMLMKKIFGTIKKTSLKEIIKSCLDWERLIINKKINK
jgi:UDP-glucose 4-epimerase